MSATPNAPGYQDPVIDKSVRRMGKRMLAVYKEQTPSIESQTAVASCSKGCYYCCQDIIMVSFPEAVAIAEHLLKNTQFWATNMETMLAKIYAQLRLLSGAVPPEEVPETVSCIFLNTEEKTCDVYDARPNRCRTLFVESDPELCKAGSGAEPAVVDLESISTDILAQARRVAKQVGGVPMGVYPLPVAFSWAMKALTEGKSILDEKAVLGELSALDLRYWDEHMQPALPAAAEHGSDREEPDDDCRILLTDAET